MRDPIKDDGENNNVGIKKNIDPHTSSPSFRLFPFPWHFDLLLILECVLDCLLLEHRREESSTS